MKLQVGPMSMKQSEQFFRQTKQMHNLLNEKSQQEFLTILHDRQDEINANKVFGKDIPFALKLEQESRITESEFEFLSDLREKSYDVRNQLTFDLATLQNNAKLVNGAAHVPPARDVQWLEENLKVRLSIWSWH